MGLQDLVAAADALAGAANVLTVAAKAGPQLSPALREEVRDLALHVAALDKLLGDWTSALLRSAGAAPDPRDSFPEAVAALSALPTAVISARLPRGGLISMLYHITAALTAGRDTLAGVTARAEGAGVRPWLAALASACCVGRTSDASAAARLRALNAHLSVLVRLWVITAALFADTNAPLLSRDRSFAMLVGAASDVDLQALEARAAGATGRHGGERAAGSTVAAAPAAAPAAPKLQLARRLLQATSLPAGAAVWASTPGSLSALAGTLQRLYAGMRAGHAALVSLPPPLNVIVALPLFVVGLAWYAARPAAAAARASAFLADPDLAFVRWLWNLAASPAYVAVASRVLLPLALRAAGGVTLALDAEVRVGGVQCHAWANVDGGGRTAAALAECAEAEAEVGGGAHAGAAAAAAAATGVAGDGASDGGGAVATSARRRRAPAGAAASPAPRAPPPDRSSLPPTLLWVHGGGFIGSAFSADTVRLGRWAGVACPSTPFLVLFPHYDLAPAAAFPVALLQLLRVYAHVRRRAPRVVLGGDSAGGNLVAALTALCIAHHPPPGGGARGPPPEWATAGLGGAVAAVPPPPDALFLAYPALNLNSGASPSRALHYNDPMVPVTLLTKLAAAYAGPPGPHTRTSPLLHPLLAPDDVVAAFPPTRILCGGLDPLLDDSVDFDTRLRRLGVPGELVVLRGLPHGLLNFRWVRGVGGVEETLRAWIFDALQLRVREGSRAALAARASG